MVYDTYRMTDSPRSPAPRRALGGVLRRLRQERGLTLEHVAYHSGITVGSLGRIERGHANPSYLTVRRIADALEVTMVEIAVAIEREH